VTPDFVQSLSYLTPPLIEGDMAKPTWKSVEQEFTQHFESMGKGAYVHRLSDTAAAKAVAGSRAFTVAQPSDFIVTCAEGTFYAEVKSTSDPDAFHFSNIRKGQMAASRRITKAGGLYVFFIKSVINQQWFCIPAPIIHAAEKAHLRWSELESYQVNMD
jgi:penicillin-binding protein-related factor A (putative recombinase)